MSNIALLLFVIANIVLLAVFLLGAVFIWGAIRHWPFLFKFPDTGWPSTFKFFQKMLGNKGLPIYYIFLGLMFLVLAIMGLIYIYK